MACRSVGVVRGGGNVQQCDVGGAAVVDSCVVVGSAAAAEVVPASVVPAGVVPADVVSTDEVIAAVDQSGFASSVDSVNIVPKSELGADTSTEAEPTVDVADMAGDQALSDINAELPQ